LFYLRARGLDIQQATEALTRAFAADLVSRTPVSATNDVISTLIESRLAELIADQMS
jgi:Fe-S cluster assembly scaffold protein SufB